MKKVLLVDDDDVFRDTCSELLTAMGYCVSTAASLSDARLATRNETFQHLLLDLILPDGSGVQLLDARGSTIPEDTSVTIMTGHPAIKKTIKSMYGSHIGYLLKPVSAAELRRVLGNDSEPQSATTAGRRSEDGFDALIGRSAPMLEVYEAIERVAKTTANVMLLGESGVGKELVAKAIHNQSGVSGPFVAANCGAFSRELIGSELFGHEKGAFTGASSRKLGVFEQSTGGTLFLDEITEMPLELQPNLLRVLEDRKFVRLGGVTSIDHDCRIISATNRTDMSDADSCLRQDLLFRLAVFPITIPPLRDRQADIPLLVEHYVAQFNEERRVVIRCSAVAVARLQEYNWPGNVRELRHTLHRAHIMSEDGGELELPEQLGLPFGRREIQAQDLKIQFGQSIEEMERQLITITLEKLDGDKKAAADVLGVSLKTLYNRLKHYEDDGAVQAAVANPESEGARA